MKLQVFKETPVRLPRKKLDRLFTRVARREGKRTGGAINLVITTDAGIRSLNREFRRKDHATDVLSFNLDDDPGEYGTFGEIYISAQTAERQARELGAALSSELLRLTCHGLLHLFGYDHETDHDAAVMQQLEERYLQAAEEA